MCTVRRCPRDPALTLAQRGPCSLRVRGASAGCGGTGSGCAHPHPAALASELARGLARSLAPRTLPRAASGSGPAGAPTGRRVRGGLPCRESRSRPQSPESDLSAAKCLGALVSYCLKPLKNPPDLRCNFVHHCFVRWWCIIASIGGEVARCLARVCLRACRGGSTPAHRCRWLLQGVPQIAPEQRRRRDRDKPHAAGPAGEFPRPGFVQLLRASPSHRQAPSSHVVLCLQARLSFLV